MDCKKILTVIISCYKSQSTIAETLESLCLDKFPQLQALIIDDGSNSKEMDEIIEGFCKRFPNNAFYYHKPNGNWGSVMNFCFSLVNTPYVSILDSDDVYCSSNLGTLLEILEKNIDKADIYLCNYQFCFKNDKKEKITNKIISTTADDLKVVPFKKHNFKKIITIHSAIFSSQLFKTCKELPENICYCDNIMIYDCLRRAQKIGYINKNVNLYVYNIRQSLQSISLEKTINNFKQLEIVFSSILNYSIERNWEKKRLKYCVKSIKIIFYWMLYVVVNDPNRDVSQKSVLYKSNIQKLLIFFDSYPWMTKYFHNLLFVEKRWGSRILFLFISLFSRWSRNSFVRATSFHKDEKKLFRILKKISKINYLTKIMSEHENK